MHRLAFLPYVGGTGNGATGEECRWNGHNGEGDGDFDINGDGDGVSSGQNDGSGIRGDKECDDSNYGGVIIFRRRKILSN